MNRLLTENLGDERKPAAAAALAEVRDVLAAFDWERGNRQLALEAIERIVSADLGCIYTHPDVFTVGVAEGWAEPETDPARIDWPARQARAAIPFDVAALDDWYGGQVFAAHVGMLREFLGEATR